MMKIAGKLLPLRLSPILNQPHQIDINIVLKTIGKDWCCPKMGDFGTEEDTARRFGTLLPTQSYQYSSSRCP